MQRKNETKNITTTPIQAYLLVLVHFLVRRRPELERRAGVGLSSEWSGVKWEWSARELLEKRGCKGKKKKKKTLASCSTFLVKGFARSAAFASSNDRALSRNAVDPRGSRC